MISKLCRAALTILLVLANLPPALADTLVFPVMGQSNAGGRGREAPPVYAFAARTCVFGNNWALRCPGRESVDSMVGQKDLISRDNAGVGPGMAFADRLAELRPNDRIVVVACAMGATSIGQWLSLSPKTLLGYCIVKAKRAATLTGGHIAGVIHWQGEGDAGVAARYNLFEARTEQYISLIRSQFGQVPIVMARLNNYAQKYIYWTSVRAAQESLAARLPNVGLVSTDQPSVTYYLETAGRVHATTAGQQVVGRAMADTMNPLLGP